MASNSHLVDAELLFEPDGRVYCSCQSELIDSGGLKGTTNEEADFTRIHIAATFRGRCNRRGPSVAPRAPVFVAAPIVTPWTGFYAGLNAGYEFSMKNTVSNAGVPVFANGGGALAEALAISTPNSVAAKNNGFIGGGQIGYNYQFATNYIAGLEADIQGLTGKGQSVGLFNSGPLVGFPAESYTGPVAVSKRISYLGTARGRLGYLFDPAVLVYATGGLAYGRVSTGVSYNVLDAVAFPAGPSAFGASSNATTKVGYTVGGGAEWMFYKNFSVKAEYLYYDLGTAKTITPVTQINAGAVFNVSNIISQTRYSGSIVRVGLNYHFNADPVAVVARY